MLQHHLPLFMAAPVRFQKTIPFTGVREYDIAVCAIFFITGLWMLIRYGKRAGYAIIALCVFWGFTLYNW